MNVLFLTIGRMESIDAHSIYPDLLRQFRDNGHDVYIVSPRERRTHLKTELSEQGHVHMLYVQIGNITKCNILEKGISTVRIESQFKSAIKKYFKDVKFDLVMYSTPPITLVGVVEYIKKHSGASSYLLLKDIFPQNAVDLGMMRKTGPKGLLYRYFRAKEKKLYQISDRIGCMSQANVDYVIKHNSEVPADKVEICPNCVEPMDMRASEEQKKKIREKYELPLDKKLIVYGGNLGKPQDVPFIVACLKACADITDAYFVIAGSGTSRHLLEEYVQHEKPENIKLFGYLPKDEYDRMIACCDIGLIFLDHRFTIPNFPSRLLAYMQAGLPVLACTDANSDIGQVIVNGGFGWWCESCEPDRFCRALKAAVNADLTDMQSLEYDYLHRHYSAEHAYHIIMRKEDRPNEGTCNCTE